MSHITVCICTYKRTRYLAYLLNKLSCQETEHLFTYSILVVDNDSSSSAQPIVSAFAEAFHIAIQYAVEPRQNIALARNMAIRTAAGDFVAFIDDDEFPPIDWLKRLFTECETRHVDGVLGPVKPHYEDSPPEWVVVGGFYNRATYPTGLVIDGRKGRTGNVLLRKVVFDGESEPFRPEFRTGEDQDFFQRMIAKGFVFTWCHEAAAYEWVPAVRWKRSFLLKRALLRGTVSILHSNVGYKDIIQSIVAVPAYLTILPFVLLVSHGTFMLCLVSLVDHVGKLLALVRLNPIKEEYITS